MSKLVYPKLSRTEIVTILVEAQIIAISEQDLLNPNPDLIADLYTRILTTFDFLPEEDEQVDFDALELLENPDFHDKSAQSIKLYNTLKQVVALLDCPKKFIYADLIRPDPNRTEVFLSALLNYHVYRETRIDLVAKVVDKLTDLEKQHIWWGSQVSQWNAEIAHYKETREKELPLVQEVDSKVKELRQTISDLNLDQVELRTSIRKLKKKASQKLLKQQELYRSKLLSYKDMVSVVTNMVKTSRSMRCFVKGSANSPFLQFSGYSECNNDPGDGGGKGEQKHRQIQFCGNVLQERKVTELDDRVTTVLGHEWEQWRIFGGVCC